MNYKQVRWWQKNLILPFSFIFAFYLAIKEFKGVQAQSPPSTPPALIELITKIDLAANNKDLESLSEYVSPQFQTSDGLDYKTFTESLSKLWQQYPNLNYKTTIESWEEKEGELIATTLTQIEGNFDSNGRKINLVSNINAQHYFSNDKLIKQEILTEKTEITSGENPPKITINLPQTVKTGDEFDFDVIVTEPLNSDLLIGGVIEEEVNRKLYNESSSIELDALSAGGIFKRVTIPLNSQDRLYSVLLIRADGLRLVTQRVKVQN
jgi:hypothetical protein